MNSKKNIQSFILVGLFAIILMPFQAQAFSAKIKTYYSGGPSGKSASVLWSVEKSDSEIAFYDVNHIRVVSMKMVEGTKKASEIVFEKALPDNPRSISKTIKKGKSDSETRIFLSIGHPVPYDWIDPYSKASGEIKVSMQSGTQKFSKTLRKDIQTITYNEALKSGYLTDENSGFIDSSKNFTLFTLTDNGKVILKQLWQDGNSFWLYEESELRKSYLTGN